ncbi:hypothetical protein IWW38_005870, partial [Coemansia aciculifera]
MLAKSRDAGSIGIGDNFDNVERDSSVTSSGLPEESDKRPALGPLTIAPRGAGFEPSGFDMSPASAGTPVTPGKQKLRPKINWGDDEDNAIPPENDRSIDAQWLRIINGAPPSRTPILPASVPKDVAKASESKSALAESQAGPVNVQSNDADDAADDDADVDEMPELRTLDDDESDEDIALIDAQVGGTDDAVKGDSEVLSNPAVNAQEPESAQNNSQSASPVVPPAPPGTRAPPRKLHSTRSFLNLSSREYDTLSDSEVDVSEAELQARFWARAMKPTKSGNSSPYSPGRRKSVVEMSSAISPRDLEEWMQWQGDSAILDRRTPSEPAGIQDDAVDQAGVVSPPTSKYMLQAADDRDEDDYSGDSSDDDALQMQRPQDTSARDALSR